MVYALVLGTSGAIRGGSSPLSGTTSFCPKRALFHKVFYNAMLLTLCQKWCIMGVNLVTHLKSPIKV